MTFEEFYGLAENPPAGSGDAVFVVEKVTVDGLEGRRRQHYPVYGVSRFVKGFCGSLEEAERFVKGLVDNELEDVFCYYVKEYPLNRRLVSEYYMESCRMYDAEGEPVDRTTCSGISDEGEYPVFRGRMREMMRFGEGDIVEFVRGGEVMLGFVVALPPSVERAWELDGKGLKLDRSDDSYVVLTTSDYRSHHHVDCMDIFKPHFPVPDYMRRKLEGSYKKWKADKYH